MAKQKFTNKAYKAQTRTVEAFDPAAPDLVLEVEFYVAKAAEIQKGVLEIQKEIEKLRQRAEAAEAAEAEGDTEAEKFEAEAEAEKFEAELKERSNKLFLEVVKGTDYEDEEGNPVSVEGHLVPEEEGGLPGSWIGFILSAIAEDVNEVRNAPKGKQTSSSTTSRASGGKAIPLHQKRR